MWNRLQMKHKKIATKKKKKVHKGEYVCSYCLKSSETSNVALDETST